MCLSRRFQENCAPLEHSAIIPFSVDDKLGVLLGAEEILACRKAVALHIIESPLLQGGQFVEHLALAGGRQAEIGGIAIFLRIFGIVMVKATVIIPRAAGCLGIDFVKIVECGADRGVQAIKIKAIKARLFLIG